jgi:hypothetical protein
LHQEHIFGGRVRAKDTAARASGLLYCALAAQLWEQKTLSILFVRCVLHQMHNGRIFKGCGITPTLLC